MGTIKDRMEADLRLASYRPRTQEVYLRAAERLAEHYMRPPTVLSSEDVRQYLLYLQDERGLKPNSMRVHFAALKFLFEVTLRKPQIVFGLRGPRVPQRLPDVLSGSEVRRLFDAIEHTVFRTLLLTTYAAGLRISETTELQARDIDSKRMLIHVRNGKGGRERFTILSRRLLFALRAYYRDFRPAGCYLFPGRRHDQPVAQTSVRNVLREAAKACGLDKHVTPHTLRHSFATHQLELGVDIRVIQALLGHKSIQSTQLYTQVSARKLAATESPLDVLGTRAGRVLG